MYSLQKPILENPFHPLDLSPEDLLRIYNRFQQSRQINKNPQQQLSIDTISQLISSLKGIKPSYVQKCISQSFIKSTISWNDFLTLLDQQSQIRQKILDWVLFYDEGSIKKYKLLKYMPFRQKIEKSFEFVTFMKLTSFGQQKFCIVEIDHEKLFLIDISENGFKQIDRFMKKNSKMNLQLYAHSQIKNKSKVPNISQVFVPYFKGKKSTNITKSMKYQSQKLISHTSNAQTAGNLRSSELTSEDDEAYFKKERKNIHSVFSIFKNLPLEDSIKLVNATANKISDKTFNGGVASSIKEAFGERMVQKKQRIQQIGSKDVTPFQRAQRKLKSLYEQKSHLSYNPYKPKRIHLPSTSELASQSFQSSFQNEKKLTHDRKQKSYILESIAISFCPEISCLALAYHNLEIMILKVGRDLNRIGFEQQDLIKITLERDHKKNQIIESVKFYHHTIRNKWFLLILIRVQYKNEGKNGKHEIGESYVLGYEVQIEENKRKTGKSYKFACNKEQTSPTKKQSFSLHIQKFEATNLQVEPRIGIHLVSFTGKYLLYREEYIQNLANPSLTQYWRLGIEEKFKNSNLSLSCFSIGSEQNKVLFGTNNGNIVLYDTFSHNFKIKRISPHPIVKVHIFGNQGFALTEDQKIIILNLIKMEEINTFSTVNEEKLHQKVFNFELEQKSREILTFGSEIKVYNQETDEGQMHKKRQMQKTYTWRLTKLKNQKQPNSSLKDRIQVKLSTQKELKNKIQPELKSSQLLISSQNYFILLSEILQVIVIEKSTMKVKFTFILNVPYDSKVMKIAISSTQKLVGVLLFNQSIYVYNIYTQQLCLYLKPTQTQKFVSITFLDPKNQYMLASGTESGKIALIPYSSVPEKKISFLRYHKNSVNIVQVRSSFLISCCEGGKIGIWQLPFNAIKHQFTLPIPSKYVSKLIGFHGNKILYLKSIDDQIFEINLSSVKLNKCLLKDEILDIQALNVMSIDSVTNELFIVSKGTLKAFTKNLETNQWVFKNKVRVYDEKAKDKKNENSAYGEPIQVGIVQSEKAVLFYEGGAFVFNYQRQSVGKYITFNQ